jgi:hypothetical protein
VLKYRATTLIQCIIQETVANYKVIISWALKLGQVKMNGCVNKVPLNVIVKLAALNFA